MFAIILPRGGLDAGARTLAYDTFRFPAASRFYIYLSALPSAEWLLGAGYIGGYTRKEALYKAKQFQKDRTKFDSVSGHHHHSSDTHGIEILRGFLAECPTFRPVGHFGDIFVLVDRRQQVHCTLRQLLLVRASRAGFGLPNALPFEHRHELVRRRPVLRCDLGSRLPQAVSRAVRQPSFDASIVEPVAEALRRERRSWAEVM